MKVREKLQWSGNFVQFLCKSGKARESRLFNPYIIFIISLSMVVCKVAVLFIVSKCELYHFAKCSSKFLYTTYLLGLILLIYFCKYVKFLSGKKWVILTIGQGFCKMQVSR